MLYKEYFIIMLIMKAFFLSCWLKGRTRKHVIGFSHFPSFFKTLTFSEATYPSKDRIEDDVYFARKCTAVPPPSVSYPFVLCVLLWPPFFLPFFETTTSRRRDVFQRSPSPQQFQSSFAQPLLSSTKHSSERILCRWPHWRGRKTRNLERGHLRSRQ